MCRRVEKWCTEDLLLGKEKLVVVVDMLIVFIGHKLLHFMEWHLYVSFLRFFVKFYEFSILIFR